MRKHGNLKHRVHRLLIGGVFACALAALAGPAHAYTTDPYSWGLVRMGGGGAVPSFTIHPKVRDVMYLGADVGPLDRWDPINLKWIPTLDWMRRIPDDVHSGIASIAIDPSDITGNVIYAATGLYTWDRGEVMKSTDRGESWIRNSKGMFNVNSNGDQPITQRLVVDPANSNIVYYAGREGLWRTLDGAVTWTKITAAPVGNPTDAGSGWSGDLMVIIDPTSGTLTSPTRTKRVIICPLNAVLSKTEDGGTTWSDMLGSPTTAYRAAISTSGVLYCTSGAGVFKYSGGASGTWTTITPPSAGGYRAVSIDPFNQNNIIVVQDASWQNPIWISKDGGATWPVQLTDNGTSETHAVNVCGFPNNWFGAQIGTIAFDPFRQGTVWIGDGWTTSNIYAAVPYWDHFVNGHEEEDITTCMLSPPSGPTLLYTGAADVGGFRHTSLTAAPAELQISFNPGGWFDNISGGDFEEADPNFVAFDGTNGWNSAGSGGYTTDGGATFHDFLSGINNPTNYGGRLAVSAASRRMVYLRGGYGASWSSDLGNTWTASNGSPTSLTGYDIFNANAPLCSDRKNGNKFYIYNGTGGFYRSTDGGANFSLVNSTLPGDSRVNLFANFTTEGDLWMSMEGNGLYHSTDSGSTWSKLPNVQSAWVAGIGAGPNSTTPSVYVMGTVDGDPNEGIFRSDNLGASWFKIDIYRPYPGRGPRYMTGDRRTYGTVYAATEIGVYYGQRSTVTTVPPVPTGVTATPGNNMVTLSWASSSTATSYNVKRSTVNGGGYATIGTSTSLGYANTGLINGTTYYYVVSAVNAIGESANSTQVSATPQLAIPVVPTGLTAIAGNAQVALSWTASSGATTYNVKRSTVNGSGYATVASPAGASYTNAGLTNGTTYYYVVSALDAAGESANSAQVSATPITTASVANAATAPVIDGNNTDAVWSIATSNPITHLSGTLPAGHAFSASYKAAWDSNNLYLLVDVADDVLMKYVTNPWDGDDIEVYIDADNNKSTSYDINDYQYEFPWNSTTIVETKHNATTGVTFGQVNVTGGYRVEISLPWTTLGVTPAANNVIGLDVHINNADTTAGTRDCKLMWWDTTDNAWQNPSLFGAGQLLSGGITIPSAPTGLTATPGNAQVALAWTASSGATSYNILRSTVSGSGYASVVTGVTTVSFTNTGLTNGTTYYFVVTATNSSGTSGNSSQASATPSASTLFVTGQTLGTLRNNFSGWVGFEFTVGSTAMTVTDLGRWVVSGNTGAHTVKLATVSTGVDVTGGSVSINTSGATAGTYKTAALAGGVTLAANTSYYIMSQETSGGDQWYDNNTTITTTADGAAIQSEWYDTVYHFGISGANSYVPLNFKYTLGGGSPPAAPTGLTATPGNAQVALTWTASTGATSYNVLRSTVSGSGYASVATGIAVTNYTNTGLTNGTTYYFVVTATNTVGTSGNSAQASATPQIAIPAAPTGLTATPGNAQVALAWTASSGATSYNVLRSTVSGSGYASVATGIAVTNYTNTGLTNGTTYYFVVSATNAGGTSANSAQASATPVAPPAAPTGLTATPGNAQVALTWSASSGATSYNVKRSTVSGSGYATVASPTTTSYTNTGLTNGTTYYFVVTALNAGGESANSSQVSATPQVAIPAAPTGLTATPGNAQVALTWNASTGATSYNVLRSTVNGSGYASVATGIAVTNYTNTGLTNGTTYYFVATATNAGGTSANSGQASAAPVAPPAAPTGLTATPGNAQVALSWTASTGATSYNVLRSTVNGSGYVSVATSIAVTNYTNTGLTNGTTYYYVVSAVNPGGTSANSSQISAVPTGGTAANAHTGTWAVVKNDPSGTSYTAGISQTANVTPNSNYVATFWVKGTGGVELDIYNANWSTLLASNRVIASSTWTQYNLNVATGSNTQLVFDFGDGLALGGTLYLDDCFLGVSGGTNVLGNPGFESGNTGWSPSTTSTTTFTILQNP